MSMRSGRLRASVRDASPPRTRKGISPPRSPARKRKTSPEPKISAARTNSPALRKSPSRKSPSRKPTRKSPSRAAKETIETNIQNQKLPSKRSSIKTDVSVKLEDFSSKIQTYRNTRSKRIEYSVTDVTSTINDFTPLDKVNGFDSNEDFKMESRKSVEQEPSHTSSKSIDNLESTPEKRRSLSKSSKSVSKSISRSIDNVSDEENSVHKYVHGVIRKLATPSRFIERQPILKGSKWEFGGRIGTAILILLIPFTTFTILNSYKISFFTVSIQDLTAYNFLNSWVSQSALILIFGQFILQALFAIIPICGIKADKLDDTGRKYCFNAIFSTIVTTFLFYALDFMYLIDLNIILLEYIKLAVTSYIFGVLLSIILYVKSKYIDSGDLNSYGNTGYALYDFFMGRELHPCLAKLDIKVWITRISNINTVLILITLISRHTLEMHIESLEMPKMQELSFNNIQEILDKINLEPTIILFLTMQLIYILTYIMKEHKVTTTFFWQSEGVGYLQTVSSALYPFYFCTTSKYVADTKLVLPTNILVIAGGLFMLGYFIMALSNNTKHIFRTKPYDIRVSRMESMPTFYGKKLLISNMWGFVRHPNYAGDILIHLALAIPGIVTQHYFAALPALLTIVMLIHRARRDDMRCSRRYGTAWNRYCQKVPSAIIPKIV
ncbi:hypothetical protein ACJJTC_001626 [Scirpophaga incertulas]